MAAAIWRAKTMVNALLRDVESKLPDDVRMTREGELDLCRQAINQERQDKDKIYSIHEPQICCIAKDKEHKKYEFGAKAAVIMPKAHCIIMGVKSFSRNEYDGDILKTVLPQAEEIRGKAALRALYGRGFRGRKCLGAMAIILPKSQSPKAADARSKTRKDFGCRSAIEPVINHLKHDFRLSPLV